MCRAIHPWPADLVRGHDHVTDRWMEYPEYADNYVPVLTINAMGRLLDGEPARRDGRTHPFPVVAKHVVNHLPEVYLLPLDAEERESVVRIDIAFASVPTRSPKNRGTQTNFESSVTVTRFWAPPRVTDWGTLGGLRHTSPRSF